MRTPRNRVKKRNRTRRMKGGVETVDQFITRNWDKIHTYISYYDMIKDASEGSKRITTENGKKLLAAAVNTLLNNNPIPPFSNDEFKKAIRRKVLASTDYPEPFRVSELQHPLFEYNDKLPEYITTGIQEVGDPNKFRKGIPVALTLASYLDPGPRSYSDIKFPESGPTNITNKQLNDIGLHQIQSITGQYDSSIGAKATINFYFEDNFDIRFKDVAHPVGDNGPYFEGNRVKNEWFDDNELSKDTIIGAKKFVICKEIGDTLQVYLAKKLAETKSDQRSVCLFSSDITVEIRSRLVGVSAVSKQWTERDKHDYSTYFFYPSDHKLDNPANVLANKKAMAKNAIANVIKINKQIRKSIQEAISDGFTIRGTTGIFRMEGRVKTKFEEISDDIFDASSYLEAVRGRIDSMEEDPTKYSERSIKQYQVFALFYKKSLLNVKRLYDASTYDVGDLKQFVINNQPRSGGATLDSSSIEEGADVDMVAGPIDIQIDANDALRRTIRNLIPDEASAVEFNCILFNYLDYVNEICINETFLRGFLTDYLSPSPYKTLQQFETEFYAFKNGLPNPVEPEVFVLPILTAEELVIANYMPNKKVKSDSEKRQPVKTVAMQSMLNKPRNQTYRVRPRRVPPMFSPEPYRDVPMLPGGRRTRRNKNKK